MTDKYDYSDESRFMAQKTLNEYMARLRKTPEMIHARVREADILSIMQTIYSDESQAFFASGCIKTTGDLVRRLADICETKTIEREIYHLLA